MEQENIEKLITKYHNYDNSMEFILASIELFNNLDSRSIKSFIEQTFTNNNIESCYAVDFFRLGKHWHNVAKTKLELNDFGSYLRSMSTSARFYAVGQFLLNKGY